MGKTKIIADSPSPGLTLSLFNVQVQERDPADGAALANMAPTGVMAKCPEILQANLRTTIYYLAIKPKVSTFECGFLRVPPLISH